MSVICPVCASENPEVAVACGVCGHRFIAPDPALPAGATLDGGRYTIERVLGRGGFGITYRARSRHRPVAIKEFFPVDRDLCGRAPGSCNLRPGREWEHFELQLRRFLDEANRLHELHHEHIVPLRDHFEENGTAYLVLDLIDGDSLAERVGRARYRPDEARALLEPLIGALEYLHGKGLAHLDVKPHNILVKSDGVPVLIDFGLARDYLSAKTRSIMLDASDGYAAIEQYSADLPRGPWTDVYALGATLYFMLAGEIPPNAPALLDGRQLVFPVGFDAGLRETIEAAMRPRAMERLRDLAAFKAVLAGSAASGGTVRRKDRQSDDCQEPIAFAHHFVDTSLLDYAYDDHPTFPVRFSPNGELLATGHKTNARLWDFESGRHLGYIGGSHTDQITDIRFDSESRWVFSCAHGETVAGYELPTDNKITCLTDISTHPIALTIVDSVGDPPMLVCATREKIYFYCDIPQRFAKANTKDRKLYCDYSFEGIGRHQEIVRLHWMENKNSIFVITKNGKIIEVSIHNPKILKEVDCNVSNLVDSILEQSNISQSLFVVGFRKIAEQFFSIVIRFSMDLKIQDEYLIDYDCFGYPKALAIGERGQPFLLTERALLTLFSAQFKTVNLGITTDALGVTFESLDISEKRVAIGHSGGGCLIFKEWVFKEGVLQRPPINHITKITSFEFTSESRSILVSRSSDKTMLWDVDSLRPLYRIPKTPSHQSGSFVFNKQSATPIASLIGGQFIMDGGDGIHDAITSKPFARLALPSDSPEKVTASAKGYSRSGALIWGTEVSQTPQLYALGSLSPFHDVKLYLWDSKGKVVNSALFTKGRLINPSCYRLNVPCGREIFIHRDGEMLVIDSDTLEVAYTINVPFPITCCVSFSGGVVVGDDQGGVRVYGRNSRQCSGFVTEHPVTEVATDSKGQLVIAHHGLVTEVRRMDSGESLLTRFDHRFSSLLVTGAWLSPSGTYLLVAFGAWNRNDQYLIIYSIKIDRLAWVGRFEGHPITAGAFLNDDLFVVSLSKRIAFFRRLHSEDNCPDKQTWHRATDSTEPLSDNVDYPFWVQPERELTLY